MNTSHTLGIIVGLLVIAALIYNRPAAKKRRTELEQQEAEQRRQVDEEEERKKNDRAAKLGKYTFVFHIRQPDGKKIGFESELIREMRELGVNVDFLPEGDLEKIAKGDLTQLQNKRFLVLGRQWQVEHNGEYHCDYRLITTDANTQGKILTSGYRSWFWIEYGKNLNFIASDLTNCALSQ